MYKHNTTGLNCPICESEVIYSQNGKYDDGKKHWNVECSNSKCGKRTPGYDTKEIALKEWKNGWGKVEEKEVNCCYGGECDKLDRDGYPDCLNCSVAASYNSMAYQE